MSASGTEIVAYPSTCCLRRRAGQSPELSCVSRLRRRWSLVSPRQGETDSPRYLLRARAASRRRALLSRVSLLMSLQRGSAGFVSVAGNRIEANLVPWCRMHHPRDPAQASGGSEVAGNARLEADLSTVRTSQNEGQSRVESEPAHLNDPENLLECVDVECMASLAACCARCLQALAGKESLRLAAFSHRSP